MVILISHLVNVLVTFAVVFSLWRDSGDMTASFGTDTPARRILSCVYLSIGLVSLYAIARTALGSPGTAAQIGLILFPLQILYKVMTAVVLGPAHPVVVANLLIVALHTVTLATAY